MFWNNVIVALRNLRKHKLFAIMNVAGLTIGMVVFVFGGLLVSYEREHDAFFTKADRTYTIGSVAAPELNIGIDKMNTTFSAVGPIVQAELSDIELMARSMIREYLVTRGDTGFYQNIRFADPDFLRIFDLDYLAGDETALDSATGALLTESMAIRYFGRTDVLGEVISLDNQHEFQVAAVVKDLPRNTHFNSLPVIEADFEMVMPIRALSRMEDFDEAGEWNNLSLGNLTYVVLGAGLDGAWLQGQMNSLYPRIVPEGEQERISEFWIKPLTYANLSLWDTFGLPVVAVVQLLSFLVLVVACVNYTNLATAQSLGRSREVGMRKTMGASRGQLLTQFLVESLVIAAIAMLVAVAVLEILIPLFNNFANKAMTLNYLSTLPFLAFIVLLVGLGTGLYPAWLITRATPIEALRDAARKGRSGSRMRSFMISAQFAISAFMLAIVSISYMQNEKIKSDSYEFPRSQIYVLQRLGVEDIRDRLDTLRYELEALPNVDRVAWSSQVPYEQNNSTFDVARREADEAGKINVNQLFFSPEFLETYDIPVLAGRALNRDVALDLRTEESEVVNVLVNELALEKLGFASPAEAINQRFYNVEEGSTLREFIIVGVVPTQNVTGLFNSLKPWIYFYDERVRIGSVRITGGDMQATVERIEDVWRDVIPDYPIQGRFLDDVFNDVYQVMSYMNMALAGFAFIALALALVGLFGLAAFMAAQRTKEIGVRKVLGASSTQIARLLVWQFSRPVIWALLVALPLAYVASDTYLNFFADRVDILVPTLLVSGLIAVLLAWGTVAAHAIRIARANPVMALRYE